jgi:endonuclease III related protein
MLEVLPESLGPALAPVCTSDPQISFIVLIAALFSRMFASRQARETLDALNGAKLLTLESVARAKPSELFEATRNLDQPLKPPSAKTLTLLHLFARWIVDQGGLDALAEIPTEQLRDDLLMIPGMSPAATDAILLYGLKRPVFPVDRPTYRIMARHGWIDPNTDYEEARAVIEEPADGNVEVLADLAYWFDRVGELYCRSTGARCDGCPLRAFLPESGPIESNTT